MTTRSQPHLTRKTVVRFAATLRVYEYGPYSPQRPVFETTGELIEELPSRPGLRKAAPQPTPLRLVSSK